MLVMVLCAETCDCWPRQRVKAAKARRKSRSWRPVESETATRPEQPISGVLWRIERPTRPRKVPKPQDERPEARRRSLFVLRGSLFQLDCTSCCGERICTSLLPSIDCTTCRCHFILHFAILISVVVALAAAFRFCPSRIRTPLLLLIGSSNLLTTLFNKTQKSRSTDDASLSTSSSTSARTILVHRLDPTPPEPPSRCLLGRNRAASHVRRAHSV